MQTAYDKLEGLKEEIKGKVTRNPDKVQHGKEMRTGELKRKQHEQDDVSLPTIPLRRPRQLTP